MERRCRRERGRCVCSRCHLEWINNTNLAFCLVYSNKSPDSLIDCFFHCPDGKPVHCRAPYKTFTHSFKRSFKPIFNLPVNLMLCFKRKCTQTHGEHLKLYTDSNSNSRRWSCKAERMSNPNEIQHDAIPLLS